MPTTPLDKIVKATSPTELPPPGKTSASQLTKPSSKKEVPRNEAAEDEEDEAAKAWAAAEARVRRVCTPKQVSGRMEADEATLRMWQDTTNGGRDQLITMMLDTDKVGLFACKSLSTNLSL